jgi:metallo-beta-lactamase family protein
MSKKNKVKIEFCGMSASDVTNSMYLISYNDKKILLDCGLYQSGNNLLKSYKINHRNYKIPFKNLDAIFISHSHSDHNSLVPHAYSKGCSCPVYMPKNNTEIAKIMWEDSFKIFQSDQGKLDRKYNIKSNLLYTQDDIDIALSHIIELDFNAKYDIFEDTTIELFHAGHIVNASQMRFEFKVDNITKSLLYTSDIGSDIPKNYLFNYEMPPYSDIVIGESTYCQDKRSHSIKDQQNDIEKIKTVIYQSCIENSNKVIFGSFSLDRLQNILTELYKIYGEDESFVIPIIIDAPLGTKISNIYDTIVEKNVELWNKVVSWKNIVWIDSYETSKYYQSINTPQIVISTSNMLTSGRVLGWLKSILPNPNNRIMFCGYSGDKDIDSLAWKIKNNKRWVDIDGEHIPNKAGITSLTSFSSHASRQELLNRYSEMNYQKLFLVHGEFDGKCVFASELKELLSKKNKTSKVICPSMGDKIKF